MDWKDLKPILGGSAPLIGKLIGVGASFIPGVGPIIGPIIGPAVGNILAGVFGVAPTPDAVANAIASNPDEVVKAKLAAATEQIKAQYDWAAKVETGEFKLEEVGITQVNETMRAETAGRVQLALQGIREHWFFTAARPAALWVFNVVSLCFGIMLTAATAKTAWAAQDPLKVLSEAWPLFASYFGPLCLVNGVYINARSTEKKTAIENGAPMPNASPPSATPPAPPKVTVPPAPKPPFIGKPPGSKD